ncbi:hypothetical protein QE374_002994 [Microbacterium sp. SORGH_AS428]|nr:hypothetical protein [Microbacterium sp. SORGH_AS_0428]
MTVRRMTPTLPLLGGEVPVFPRGRNPRPLGWGVIATSVVVGLIAAVSDELSRRVLFGALAVMLMVIGIALLITFQGVVSRALTIDDRPGALRFVPLRVGSVPMLFIAVSLLLPAGAQLFIDLNGLPAPWGPRLTRSGPYILGVIGIATLVVRIVRRRVPAGLTLSPRGVTGIRGCGALDWPWDELAQVSVVAAPAARLSLLRAGGAPLITAPSLSLGSDPNLVAALVEFYRQHPEHRDALEVGGVEAVRRAEQVLHS